ncbi:hypothetical protein VPH35_036761 [Triticum aestivum]
MALGEPFPAATHEAITSSAALGIIVLRDTDKDSVVVPFFPNSRSWCGYVMVEVQEYFCCLFRFCLGTTLRFAWVVVAVRFGVQSTGEGACSAVARCSQF